MTIPGLNNRELRAYRTLQRSTGTKRRDVQMTFGQLYDLFDNLKIGSSVSLRRGGSISYVMPYGNDIIFRVNKFPVSYKNALKICVLARKDLWDISDKIENKLVYVGNNTEIPQALVDHEFDKNGSILLHTEYLPISWE